MTGLNQGPLNATDQKLLNILEQEYLLSRLVPSAKVIEEKYAIAQQSYRSAFKKALFRQSLRARGIIIRGITDVEDDELPGILTPEQLICANTILDLTDNRSRKKKLADLGVATATYEGWLRDPAFQNYLRQRTEHYLGDNVHEAHLALVDRAKTGDVNALKLYYEITGRHVSGSEKAIDVQFLLTRILEIVMKYVDDPIKLEAMGAELEALGKSQGIAKQLTSAPATPEGLIAL